MTRAAFATVTAAVHEWLRAGNTGTSRQISDTLGLKWHSVRGAITRLIADGFVTICGSVDTSNGPANVYASATDQRWVWCDRARLAKGIVGTALARRTDIERVWHG